MKKRNLRVLVLLVGFLVGMGCLGAVAQNDSATGTRSTLAATSEDESWRDDGWHQNEDDEFDEDQEEGFDEERELDWELAEQSLLASSIEFEAGVATDEVKTAVVTATLLLEHAEPTTAIDTLTKAIDKTTSPAVKRALQLKLVEAHIENDDESSAISIATRLLVGD